MFQLPLAFDLAATGLFGLSGALLAVRKNYDIAGLATLSLVAGLGGSLIRDGIFLQDGPPIVVRDPSYILAVVVAIGIGWFFGAVIHRRFTALFLLVDALGLGAYAIVGAQKSFEAGLTVPAAVVVGAVNAVGGGMLRDVLAREEPEVFKPGGYYASAAFLGAVAYASLRRLGWEATFAALTGIALATGLRLLSLRFGWSTRSAPGRIARSKGKGAS